MTIGLRELALTKLAESSERTLLEQANYKGFEDACNAYGLNKSAAVLLYKKAKAYKAYSDNFQKNPFATTAYFEKEANAWDWAKDKLNKTFNYIVKKPQEYIGGTLGGAIGGAVGVLNPNNWNGDFFKNVKDTASIGWGAGRGVVNDLYSAKGQKQMATNLWHGTKALGAAVGGTIAAIPGVVAGAANATGYIPKYLAGKLVGANQPGFMEGLANNYYAGSNWIDKNLGWKDYNLGALKNKIDNFAENDWQAYRDYNGIRAGTLGDKLTNFSRGMINVGGSGLVPIGVGGAVVKGVRALSPTAARVISGALSMTGNSNIGLHGAGGMLVAGFTGNQLSDQVDQYNMLSRERQQLADAAAAQTNFERAYNSAAYNPDSNSSFSNQQANYSPYNHTNAYV